MRMIFTAIPVSLAAAAALILLPDCDVNAHYIVGVVAGAVVGIAIAIDFDRSEKS